MTIGAGARGTYGYAYLDEWRRVLSGADPWASAPDAALNAYGPLFSALAPLVWLSPLAPKLLFSAGYLGFVVWLIGYAGAGDGPRRSPSLAMLFWVLNPLPWIRWHILDNSMSSLEFSA